jgi:hypothetical protein
MLNDTFGPARVNFPHPDDLMENHNLLRTYAVSAGTSPDIMFPDPLPVPALVVDGVPWGLEPTHPDGDEKVRPLACINFSQYQENGIVNHEKIFRKECVLHLFAYFPSAFHSNRTTRSRARFY